MRFKKIFYLFIVLLFYSDLFSQNNDTINKNISIFIDGGVSYFDGDIPQTSLLPGSIPQFSIGYGFEYHLNNIWSLSLDNYYYNLKGENNYAYINTKLSEFDVNTNINLTKIIFPNSNSKTTVNGSIGLGMSYYSFNSVIKDNDSSITKLIVPKNDISINVPISLYVNHQISQNFSIGYKIKYVSNNKDNLEGLIIRGTSYKGVTNDFISSGTIYLKYTIIDKKNKKINIDKNINNTDNDNKIVQKNYFIINNIINDNYQSKKDTIVSNTKNTNNINNTDSTINKIDYYIPSIFFDFNKYDLDKNSENIILRASDIMKQYSNLRIEITGYCDSKGDYDYNLKLSNKRCDVIKNKLILNGISSDRIITNGMGKINIPNTKYRYNRRCDLKLY